MATKKGSTEGKKGKEGNQKPSSPFFDRRTNLGEEVPQIEVEKSFWMSRQSHGV